jgi:N-hydroxyarylamine O-acetyltransferase
VTPTPSTSFSLDGYLKRINWSGSREPTFDTLSGLLRGHMTAIPFENLDVLLGRGVRIDLDNVYAKLVSSGRGGYCFEHGALFQAALASLGYAPVAHTARVVMLRPKAEAPLTHMVLTVAIGGRPFILDPGFGGHAPIVPVPLEPGSEARSGADRHRMVRAGQDWVLEVHIDGRPMPLWSSTLEPVEPVDFVMANHFVSTFASSPFVTSLMLRAITADARVSVMNQALTIRQGHGEQKRTIAGRAELRALLVEHFGFDVADVEQMRVPAIEGWQ